MTKTFSSFAASLIASVVGIAGCTATSDDVASTGAQPLSCAAPDPFGPIAKPIMSGAQLSDALAAADSPDGTLVGTFDLHARERDCPGACDVWQDWKSPTLVAAAGGAWPAPTRGQVFAFRGSLVFAAAIPGSTGRSLGQGYLFMITKPTDNGQLEDGATMRTTGPRAFTPKNLWDVPFTDTYLVFPSPSDQAPDTGWPGMIHFEGHVYKDGTVRLTTLVGPGGTGIGTHQLAIVGKLDPL